MAASPADRFSPREVLRHFLQTLPQSVGEFERAVLELLDSSWDEPLRRRAHEMASVLAEATAGSGLSDLAPVVRAMASILKLRLEDTVVIQNELGMKLRELLAILEELRLRSEDAAQA
jgi:hypothetical protein